MAESGAGAGEQEGGAAEYAPRKSSGRMIGAVLALLVITNLITGVTVFYLVPAAPPPVEKPLRVIGPWAGTEKDKFLPVLDIFKENTGIDYEYITTRQEDLQSLLPNWFAAQRAPADLIFMPSSFVKQYGMDGHAADLAGTISESNYAPGALDPLKDGTAIYGGAYTGKVKPGFWYKKSFFTESNLAPPTTWAEFETLLVDIEPLVPNEPIISGDGVGWPLSDVTEHFIATYGGPGMHRQLTAGTLAWTATSVQDVFADHLVRTLTPGTVCTLSCWSAPRQWDTGVTEWWNGDYGLYFMGSWITGMGTVAAPGPALNPADLGVFSLPEAPGAQGIVFAADYFFVPSYAENLPEAKQLAVFLSTAEAQTQQVSVGGHIATALGVPLSAYPAVDAGIAALMTGKEVLSDMDDTIGGTFQTTFWSELQGLWASPTSLTTVLANIEAAMP